MYTYTCICMEKKVFINNIVLKLPLTNGHFSYTARFTIPQVWPHKRGRGHCMQYVSIDVCLYCTYDCMYIHVSMYVGIYVSYYACMYVY